jgi:hypothetical protein
VARECHSIVIARAKQPPRSSLDDTSDVELDRQAELGFDWVRLLSLWQTRPIGQRVSRSNNPWRRKVEAALPDLREPDIVGSGFAVVS